MTNRIIFKYFEDDDCNVAQAGDDEREVICLDARAENHYIHTNLKQLAAQIPFTSFQQELVHFACAIYSADRRILREKAYDKWTRDIHICFPAIDIDKWESIRDILKSALSFLTGDRWTLTFYPTGFRHDSVKPVVLENVAHVALLSGGLDSFIGAIDLLERHRDGITFVSHHSSGSAEHIFQRGVVKFLRDRYADRVNHFDFFAQLRGGRRTAEYSSRSRSFMYFMLGITVAEALKSSSFVVAENGFMSLNVPLTRARIGSLSTRTTHPHYVDLIRELTRALDINVSIVTPYQFKTKGEMITGSRNVDAVKDGYQLTRSCSTSSGRFRGHSPKNHCGRCFPCIVRRAALYKAGFDPGAFDADVLSVDEIDGKAFPDLWAVKVAAQKFESKPPTVFDIIGNAPISRDIDDFLGVFTRGIEELASFLKT